MIIPIAHKRPNIDDSVLITPGCVITGDVVIKARSSIWFQSVIRGDGDQIRIGKGTNIQDLCMLHADPGFPLSIGDDVTVGHRVVLHGCCIEHDCLIGIGAVILNGAVLGQGSVVAAGAVVLENTKVPPGSLVAGVPATVKKQLGEAAVEKTRTIAADYVRRAREYKQILEKSGHIK